MSLRHPTLKCKLTFPCYFYYKNSISGISISEWSKSRTYSVGEKGKFCDINFDYYTECSLLAKMSLSNKNSFFDTNNDIDDDAFLNHPRAGSSGFMLPQSSNQGGINQFQPVQQSRQQVLGAFCPTIHIFCAFTCPPSICKVRKMRENTVCNIVFLSIDHLM